MPCHFSTKFVAQLVLTGADLLRNCQKPSGSPNQSKYKEEKSSSARAQGQVSPSKVTAEALAKMPTSQLLPRSLFVIYLNHSESIRTLLGAPGRTTRNKDTTSNYIIQQSVAPCVPSLRHLTLCSNSPRS